MATALRVLVVEDDDVDWMALRRKAAGIRTWRLELHREADLEAGLAALVDGGFDLVLLDFRLGAQDALDFLEQLRSLDDVQPLPVIVLTGFDNPEIDRAVMDAGAEDYLPKDQLTPALLERTIRHALDRWKLRRQLEQRTEGLRAIAANADGVVVVDRDDRVVWANQAARGLLELQGDLPLPLPFDTAEAGERELATESGPWKTLDVRRADAVWDGEPAQVVSLRDVTASRKLQADLLQASKMSVVGQLAGGIAHDFNNILMAILGWIELAERPDQQQNVGRYLGEIELSARRAADLTARLLAFSRKSVGPIRVVDLNETVESMGTLLERVCGRSASLRFSRSPGSLPVRLDPTELGQIVMNLVVNAADATMHGDEIVIQIDQLPPGAQPDCDCPEVSLIAPAGLAKLTVTDRGEGIAPDVLPSIFEPFFTTKAPGEGSGIGLSTVYGIVHRAGGHVCASSTLGCGTSVKVCLPVAEQVPVDLATDPSIQGIHLPTDIVLLVVDDEAPIRDVVSRRFAQEGFEVVTASSGAEALEFAKTRRFDLVLTDIVMPGMDGLELAHLLRERHPDLDVILMTGFAGGVDDEGFEVLGKPFRLQEAISLVRRTLALNRGRSPR